MDNFIDILNDTTRDISDSKLSQTLKDEVGIDIEESKEIVERISTTIDLIDENYQDLQRAKESGKSRGEWLRTKLNENIKTYTDSKKEEFAKELRDSLEVANREIGIDIFDIDMELSKPLASYKYDELNQKAIIGEFQKQIQDNTMLGSIINGDKKFEVNTTKDIEAVKIYFEKELNSDYDRDFKKAVSVATEIAKQKNLLPKQIIDKTPEEIAMIVDRSLTSTKVAYKLSKGELNPIDALEVIIDRNTAILNSAIIKTTTKYGELWGGKLGTTIGSVFGVGGAVLGAKVGKTVGKLAGHKVGEAISRGVKKVATVAKSLASKALEGVKSIASSLNLNW